VVRLSSAAVPKGRYVGPWAGGWLDHSAAVGWKSPAGTYGHSPRGWLPRRTAATTRACTWWTMQWG